jgi:hypothetical protein
MRFSLRTIAIACLLLCVLLTYVGSYYRLSRRGMREAEVYDMDGFYYIPMEELMLSHSFEGKHFRRATFYAPANAIDRMWFGGKPIGSSPLRSISG